MTAERERILQKIRRVQALAERGVAGEQESAAATLDRLMKQYGITEAELEEIRQELQEGGYVRPDGGKKKIRQAKLLPMKFTSTDGYEILVGRNNRQNELLTFKQARKNDLWLHAQKVHGAHVLILCSNTTPPDDTVTEAAAPAVI